MGKLRRFGGGGGKQPLHYTYSYTYTYMCTTAVSFSLYNSLSLSLSYFYSSRERSTSSSRITKRYEKKRTHHHTQSPLAQTSFLFFLPWQRDSLSPLSLYLSTHRNHSPQFLQFFYKKRLRIERNLLTLAPSKTDAASDFDFFFFIVVFFVNPRSRRS